MNKKVAQIKSISLEGVTSMEAYTVSEALKGTRNSGLTTESFISFLNFKRAIDNIATKRQESLKLLMEAYKIKPTPNPLTGGFGYNFVRNPKETEIQEKLDGINAEKNTLTCTVNFMSKEEFFEFTKKLDMDPIALMSKYLLKN
jgi:hypothetical protein